MRGYLLLGLLVLLAVPQLHALCVVPDDRRFFANATLVFTGVAVSEDRLSVRRLLLGRASGTLSIGTIERSCNNCELPRPLTEGEEYLVSARGLIGDLLLSATIDHDVERRTRFLNRRALRTREEILSRWDAWVNSNESAAEIIDYMRYADVHDWKEGWSLSAEIAEEFHQLACKIAKVERCDRQLARMLRQEAGKQLSLLVRELSDEPRDYSSPRPEELVMSRPEFMELKERCAPVDLGEWGCW